MEFTAYKINEYVKENKFDELVRRSEEAHESQYEMLLRSIEEANNSTEDGRFTGAVLVTGPSSSGKTTFSKLLDRKLTAKGFNCTVISIDDYYRDRDELNHEQEQNGTFEKNGGTYDYECVEAFNVALFRKQMGEFISGKEIQIPVYDFNCGKMISESGRFVKPTGHDILIVEGIQAMNPVLWDGVGFSRAFKVYICPFDVYAADGGEDVISSPQVRFMRRAIRDYVKRNSSLEHTMRFWKSVRRGEENYIKPMKKFADFFFNSSLCYEISFLKKEIYEMCAEISDEDKEYLGTILNFEALDHFLPFGNFKIPEDSIFNEFYLDTGV